MIWFKQRGFYEEVVDNSFEFKLLSSPINGTLSTVANVLNLRRLDRTDYRNEYLCRAATRFYYPPLLQSITIDMNCKLVCLSYCISSLLYYSTLL